MRPRALDLFCGGGGVSEGLLLAGFDVVGVDLDPARAKAYTRGPGNPERHERPAVFVQADALEYPLEGLDFIWASPPCQAHSVLRKLCPGKEYPDLIPATRERLIASGIPYAIENVPGAPLGGHLVQLCGTMFGLQTPDGRAELRRHRLFETSWPIALRPACQHGHVGLESLTVCGTGMGPGNRGKEAEQRERREAGSARVLDHGRGDIPGPADPRTRVITVVGQEGLPGLSHERRRAISISGHASEISPSNWGKRKVVCIGGGKAMSGGMPKPTRGKGIEDWQRRTMSITGNTPQTNVVRNTIRETFSTNDARAAMGIDWMAMKDLSQAIPPAYSRWIGERALEEIGVSWAKGTPA